MPTSPVGTSGWPTTTTASFDAGPVPRPFTAITRNQIMVSLTRPDTVDTVPDVTRSSTVVQMRPSIEYWTMWLVTGSSAAENADSHDRTAEESPPWPVRPVGAPGGPTGATVIAIGLTLRPMVSTAVTWNV